MTHVTQEEILRELNEILWDYCKPDHKLVSDLCMAIHRIVKTRGITLNHPMYHTARLIVARDVLRIWEPE